MVKPGDVVRVKVQEIDIQRKRISLTMKVGEAHIRHAAKPKSEKNQYSRPQNQNKSKQNAKQNAKPKAQYKANGPADASSLTALADAFNKARK